MGRIVKWAWFVFVMRLTGFLPDFKFVMRMRGFLVRPSFRRCGRNFQIGTNVSMIYTSNISVGDDVYIAYGSWIQGIGGVTFEDKAMLGPYTVLAT